MNKKLKVVLIGIILIVIVGVVIAFAKPKESTTTIAVTTEDPNANQPMGVTISSEYSTEE